MRILTILAAALIAQIFSAPAALAEPVSIRGLNWSMTQDEQLEVLEKEGLDCAVEPGWQRSGLPIRTDRYPAVPRCIARGANNFDARDMQIAYRKKVIACIIDSNSNACRDGAYDHMERHTAVFFTDWLGSEAIVFKCGFVGTCDYTTQAVVKELRRRVIDVPFGKTEPNAVFECAFKDHGDQLCINPSTNDIWLIESTSTGTMEF